MKNSLLYLSLALILFACNQSQKPEVNNFLKETANPVPSKDVFPDIPFWNAYAKIFIYAPAFDFKEIEGAIKYKYTILSAVNGEEYTFEADLPNQDLGPVWPIVPIGIADLTVKAIDENGEQIGNTYSKKMYRAAPFTGVHNSPKNPYRKVAIDALKYIFELPHIQKWDVDGKPDLNYSLYGYPSKIISSLMKGMLLYSDLESTTKEDSAKAMNIAIKMGEHLISISKSTNPLLSAFVPTYDMEFVNKRKQIPNITDENGVNNVATKNENKLMMLYGYEYGNVLLDMYDRTKDEKWKEIAFSIAKTYKELQLPEGNWNLNIDYHTAKPLDKSMMMPTKLMMFLKRLEEEYGVTGYAEVIKKANNWIQNNPMKTFFWEAQFEDVPTYDTKYHNLSKYPPSDYAMYLLKYDASEENILKAKELVRFAEDQFVVWENPPNDSLLFNRWASKDTVKWLTPCVLEQYYFYVPVDASACQMINSFMAIYNKTNEDIYLQKATALLNSITQAQLGNGEITTVWTKSGFVTENWLNCMVSSAKTLIKYSEQSK